ncbi:helix-turn-helix domain-containing protein [Salmonella enterica]|uniref:YdaS family helix-turn-helix protein n=1 Tax=Salmonella enterica subsp. enterica serovar Abeokuta TaxID=2926665 RepID=A0A8T9IEP9_SALET|nr:YdaS family helix-turn-helix protein [Salmonella enterica]SQJ25054.1 Uncharacterized protein conserved in bacteria, prophage-related [Salmonella enterica subsp. enterica] [Salmonella enterica subsp. enterica serovar Menston]ECE1929298.1 hypothetical protein [Salmonella enterica]EDW9823540.1 hypothetical protein [Salmonella enterica]EKC9955231.1 helix-turn-helix domain-containing protein [Salmonella enterica]UNO32312.1 YdaS family helix-turn-helix protein [Salmonella enterica subsp. enterica
MQLHEFIKTLERGGQSKLARAIKISTPFLNQIASGYSPVPPSRALAIELATNGQVTRKELCPDTWHLYWTESELQFTANKRGEVEPQ